MLCLMASIKKCIPPDDGMQTGFSRRLDISDIENLPLMLVGINRQRMAVDSMILLGREFFNLKDDIPPINDLPDDPVELIESYEKEVKKHLREQRKILDNIVDIIKSGWKDKTECVQLSFD